MVALVWSPMMRLLMPSSLELIFSARLAQYCALRW